MEKYIFSGVIIAVLIVILYFLNKKDATKIAVEVAKKLIIQAEHYADELALKDGKEKFDWVAEHGYDLLPVTARIFISKKAFKMIIQFVFDELIDWAEASK